MGSVLSPLLRGLENVRELPCASTGCNQCASVCPVRIPLPKLMHRRHEEQVVRGRRPRRERLLIGAWAWLAGRPKLYRWRAAHAARYLRWLAGDPSAIRVFGLAPASTEGRDLPLGPGQISHQLYAARKRA
jgi:L-lactate dehydrogenase complex protein LldF